MKAPTDADLSQPFCTPDHLAGLDADVWIRCAPMLASQCAYRAFWTHEELAAKFGPKTFLEWVKWRCPACGGSRVAWSLDLRSARSRETRDVPRSAAYAMTVAPFGEDTWGPVVALKRPR